MNPHRMFGFRFWIDKLIKKSSISIYPQEVNEEILALRENIMQQNDKINILENTLHHLTEEFEKITLHLTSSNLIAKDNISNVKKELIPMSSVDVLLALR